jgi:dipeptidyl aminopeptidase/acylaminoacyl peptidase
LHGYLTMPAPPGGRQAAAGADAARRPVRRCDNWFYDNDAQFLASRGYAVLQVNFRGSGGRGVDFKEAGYREWGGKIQDDLVDGVRWAIAGRSRRRRACACTAPASAATRP